MSKELNIPPFYVGQRVVAIKNHSQSAFKEGDRFICVRCRLFDGSWSIDIGLTSPSNMLYIRRLKKTFTLEDNTWWMNPNCFVPVEENFQSITLEKVLEQETKLVGAN